MSSFFFAAKDKLVKTMLVFRPVLLLLFFFVDGAHPFDPFRLPARSTAATSNKHHTTVLSIYIYIYT